METLEPGMRKRPVRWRQGDQEFKVMLQSEEASLCYMRLDPPTPPKKKT